jgi:lambda family phage portal protein
MRELGYHERGGRREKSMNWLDRAVDYFSPAAGLRRTRARVIHELALQYRGAEATRLRSDWIIGTSTATTGASERITLRERSRDLNRNDAVASGATDTMAINVVGQGLQLQSRIRAERIGVTEDAARELQKQAETIWTDWKQTADSTNICDFDELQFLALRKIVEDGEIIVLPIMIDDSWRSLKRAIELIEADRLINYGAGLNLSNVDSAVETGARGEPVAYYLEKAGSSVGEKKQSVRIEARDERGRPKILHLFPVRRPGQLRGVPWFAPVMTLFKDLGDTLEAEVVAARVSACLAVFVTMNDPAYAQYAAHTGTETDTGNRLQALEPGNISYLNQGESINVVNPNRPGDTFAPFVEMVIRMIGMSLNLPYELLSKDFSKTNYSSARAAILEGRRMFTTWRSWFGRRFCQPIYDLVLEEAFLRGLFAAPNFYEYRSEYTRAQWIGGGWGWVDPVKEVEASRKAIDYGLSTLAEEAAGQGRDWEEILEQQKREQDKAGELEIELFHAGGAAKQAAPVPEQQEGETDAETEEEREQG